MLSIDRSARRPASAKMFVPASGHRPPSASPLPGAVATCLPANAVVWGEVQRVRCLLGLRCPICTLMPIASAPFAASLSRASQMAPTPGASSWATAASRPAQVDVPDSWHCPALMLCLPARAQSGQGCLGSVPCRCCSSRLPIHANEKLHLRLEVLTGGGTQQFAALQGCQRICIYARKKDSWIRHGLSSCQKLSVDFVQKRLRCCSTPSCPA